MPEFTDFLGLPDWTRETLDAFLALAHNEDHAVEYKGGEWILEAGSARPTLERARFKDLREYAAGISNVGGGLLFLGVTQKSPGTPGTPDGVPDSAWVPGAPNGRLGDVLWDGIYPRLYPPPRIFVVPLMERPGNSVVLIEFPMPIHKYYRVLHGGGFVPLRFSDGLRRAPPGLEAVISGERGSSAAAIDLAPFAEDELDLLYSKKPYEFYSYSNGRVLAEYPFRLSNHGLSALRQPTVGIVVSRNEVIQSMYSMKEGGHREEQTFALPATLRSIYKVAEPTTRVVSLSRDLQPLQEIEILFGVELQVDPGKGPARKGRLFSVHIGLWVSGDGIEPLFKAYEFWRASLPAEPRNHMTALDELPFVMG